MPGTAYFDRTSSPRVRRNAQPDHPERDHSCLARIRVVVGAASHARGVFAPPSEDWRLARRHSRDTQRQMASLDHGSARSLAVWNRVHHAGFGNRAEPVARGPCLGRGHDPGGDGRAPRCPLAQPAATPSLESMPSWQKRLSKITHTLLYILLFVTPTDGWIAVSAGRQLLSWFGVLPLPSAPVSHSLSTAAEELHP